VQTQLLDKYPNAPLRVYAVWFNMYPGDERSKWPASLLADGRVTHLWDEEKIVGRWYNERADSMRPSLTPESKWNGQILWDSYLLYAPDATWDDAPTRLLRWGRTIVAAREALRRDFEAMFATAP
jgi:hypothetical protein